MAGVSRKGGGASPPISAEDYAAVEARLLADPQVAAYLDARDDRVRNQGAAEAGDLLGALKTQVGLLSAMAHQVGNGSIAIAEQDPHMRMMRNELRQLSAHIEQTKSEIAQMVPKDSGNSRILAATSELDAIVTSTERATSDILSAAEAIQATTERLARTGHIEVIEIASEIENHVMSILLACSFQDITGQRTTKVVNTLRYIEHRVTAMIGIWGVEGQGDAMMPTKPGDTRPDAHLLHGPAMDAPDQGNIDALFNAGFNAGGDAAKPAAPAGGPASQSDIDNLFD